MQLLLRAVLGQALAWWSHPARGADIQIRGERDVVVGPGSFLDCPKISNLGCFFFLEGEFLEGELSDPPGPNYARKWTKTHPQENTPPRTWLCVLGGELAAPIFLQK